MAKDGEPILLAFRPKEDLLKVCHIEGWKVTSIATVVIGEDDKPVCDCAFFRMKDSCQHVAFMGKQTQQATARDDWVEISPTSLSGRRVGHCNMKSTKSGLLDDLLPDCLLHELVWDLTADEPKLKKGETGELLNSGRLYQQCQVSFSKGAAVIDPEVKAAGVGVKPLDAEGVEDKPEEFMDMADFEKDMKATSSDEAEAAADAIEEETEKEGVTPSTKSWKKVPMPDPKYFFVERAVWETVLYDMVHGKNMLVVGPSGSGKSELMYIAAKAIDLPLAAFNMGAMSEPRLALVGATHFSKESGTFFNESRFIRHVRQTRGVILLDEISRAERGAFNLLLPLMDRQGYVALDESEDAGIVHKGDMISFVATANIGMEYTGTDELDKALKERFSDVIDLWFPPQGNERQILVTRCGLDPRIAARLVEIAGKQRQMARDEEEFQTFISTRMLLAAGERIANGMDFDVACGFTIENHFSADGGDASDRAKVKQIVQKGGAA